MNTEIQGYNRETLLAILFNREVEIKFHKSTGELRLMRATLREDLIPFELKADNDSTTSNPNLITLWDLDVNEWRSVRTDRIVEVL